MYALIVVVVLCGDEYVYFFVLGWRKHSTEGGDWGWEGGAWGARRAKGEVGGAEGKGGGGGGRGVGGVMAATAAEENFEN